VTLAPPGVRDDLDAKSTDRSPKPLFHDRQRSEKGEIESASIRKGNITLEGVKDSSKGSGATPTRVARATPQKLDRRESLYSSTSARIETQGLLSRVSIRDTLTDAHNQKTRVQIEAPDSTLPVRTCDCQNVMTTIASNTEKGSCELARARLNSDRRIRNWLVRIDRPRAQGRRSPPDVGTGTRAFNAPAVFSPNPTVT